MPEAAANTEETREEETFNFLGMSDAEIRDMDPYSNDTPQAADAGEESGEAQASQDSEAGDNTPENQKEADGREQSSTSENEQLAAEQAQGEEQGAQDREQASGQREARREQSEQDQAEKTADSSTGEEKASDGVDYKSYYEELTAPLPVGGKQIKIGSVEEARALMSKGVGFHKRMEQLKPNLKIVRMLENNGLLDEEKLSFLIDVNKRDPKALQKLLKDANVDPMDLDTQSESDYKPGNYKVDDQEMALDAVLAEISETPTYDRTLEVLSKEWDPESKRAVANQPELIRVINTHVANGIYDLISAEIERERMLGQHVGIPEIQAYQRVGDAMAARGAFDHIGGPKNRSTANGKTPSNAAGEQRQTGERKPSETNGSSQADPDNVRTRRRAASPSKAKAAPVQADVNMLGLSDAEFLKQRAAQRNQSY